MLQCQKREKGTLREKGPRAAPHCACPLKASYYRSTIATYYNCTTTMVPEVEGSPVGS